MNLSSASSSTINSSATPVLQLKAISKSYAQTLVLEEITLSLQRGEVLALTGENGAGKSTVSKIICGLTSASSGSLLLNGQIYTPSSRRDAETQGVRMVLQELGLIPTLTVAENLLMGHLPHHLGWLNKTALRERAIQQLNKMGLGQLNPDTLVSELGIGQQQMVEIARNLQDNLQVLILDEPTAMLTPRESTHLFQQIAELKAKGVAIIYVSHRLEELQKIADTVAVLRDGRLVDVRAMAGVQEKDLVQRMVGRAVDDLNQQVARPQGRVALQVEKISRAKAVKAVSFELHHGEILGIAGLVGSGRTELLRLLFGADKADSGQIQIQRKDQLLKITPNWSSPLAAIQAGLGLVTEDRKSQGLLLPQSIAHNISLGNTARIAVKGFVARLREKVLAAKWIKALAIRSFGAEQAVATLSGGNQQKVVFARWLEKDCDILLLDEPTRGVDVGARSDIYAQINQMAADGKAIVMVSSDLRELMAVSDRIGVMSMGRLVALFKRGEWTEQALLEAAFTQS
ncbi:sugar ABC transporter ATP-binding protein [uncultured Thiothrix sp.]|uniref:sugar ABC transporter ATP-binding protein n=1 Tax=uncultured Thiothrix sp. TaxID=223185 RepID=UPI0026152F9B|nr:sugar ABC transporter ATP-binding protein [uncultured Thiothrix sp.]